MSAFVCVCIIFVNCIFACGRACRRGCLSDHRATANTFTTSLKSCCERKVLSVVTLTLFSFGSKFVVEWMVAAVVVVVVAAVCVFSSVTWRRKRGKEGDCLVRGEGEMYVFVCVEEGGWLGGGRGGR